MDNDGRTVFKVMGSLGPAGSLVTLCEKVCRYFYYEAYTLQDPLHQVTSEDSTKAEEQRRNYVNKLFEVKSRMLKHL